MTHTYRRCLKLARTMHLYVTLFGLVLILFFAFTGFMLNHEDWFGLGEPVVVTREANLAPTLLNPVDKFELVEAIRRDLGVAGAVNTFRTEEESVEVEFLRPGHRTVVEIRRETGRATATFEARGWAGIATDLHKGKSAGVVWSVLIDAVCVLLFVIATTGLILWSSLRSRGKWGAVSILFGIAISTAIYYWCVP